MECNKEEAIRAKEIAEKKMETEDFFGARKIAQKAQQLYPGLENISQMITVCNVHISAETKINGTEKDWYGILNIDPTADDLLIKKQYRKFALLLHPDKNKFSGSADAFKLIGEAQRVLLDREKRLLHDSKCKASGRSASSNWTQKPNARSSNNAHPPWMQTNFASGFPINSQAHQVQSGSYGNKPTFWTVCPFCSVRYQFYKDVMNKLLYCQSCHRSFTGYEMNSQGHTPVLQNWAQKNQVPVTDFAQSHSHNAAAKSGFQESNGSQNARAPFVNTKFYSGVVEGLKIDENGRNFDEKTNKVEKSKESKANAKKNRIRKKRIEESSESCETDSSTDSEEEIVLEKGINASSGEINFECYGDHPRRSSRAKRNVSYFENASDDEDLKPSKKAKGKGGAENEEEVDEDSLLKEEGKGKTGISPGRPVDSDVVKESEREENYKVKPQYRGEEVEKKEENVDTKKIGGITSREAEAERKPQLFEYPDPDFSNFEKGREEDCFAPGQMWAIYDDHDAMPRYYAQIKKVLSPGFKLHITWLEPDPDDDDETKWLEKKLPISCGKFKRGFTEQTEDCPMFSHLTLWEKGNKRDKFKIYPQKGETWALFKNWDMNWLSSDTNREKKYEYEFVEILSEYDANVGVHVSYLGKVKGFVCLFCRKTEEEISVLIPPKEIFRFAHRVPSFRMTGEERENVPKGSFELDPAALPTDLKEIPASEDIKFVHGKKDLDCSFFRFPKPEMNSEEKFSANPEESTHLDRSCNDSSNLHEDRGPKPMSEPYEVPETLFYNFECNKSSENFEVGQFWAMYSDEEGLPKYYGQITKIESGPKFVIHVAMLIVASWQKGVTQWLDRKMPVCCGRFKVKKRKKPEIFEGTVCFSHQLKPQATNRKDVYSIYPKKGEVWAVYKNWSLEMSYYYLDECKYEMVEILEEDKSYIEVLFLELVDGFKSVFKAKMAKQSRVMKRISHIEILRFSHQIPSFHLTDERDGSLRGFWELDPAALPAYLFHR